MRETMLGKTVTVRIDHPLGSAWEACERLPVNIGVTAELPERPLTYVLGADEPLESFTGTVIAVIRSRGQSPVRLVAAPPELRLHQGEILEQLWFREKDRRWRITALYERSCGVIPYRITAAGIEYLVLLQRGSHTWSFPKGHMEPFESELQTATRELREETQQSCLLIPGFRETLTYSMGHRRKKTIVLFLGRFDRAPQPQRTEILQFRFLPREEAIELLRHSPYRRILLAADAAIQANTPRKKEVHSP